MWTKWFGIALAGFGLGCGTPTPKQITIATINDFHGALYETPTQEDGIVAGGLPWLVGLLDVWRKEQTPVVLLDGGDLFQGTWTVNASKGMAAVEAFNLLGVDASGVGNHEFDYGGEANCHPLRCALETAAKSANWHWLSANITDKTNGKPWAPDGIQATAIVERGGLNIGVIGLTTTDTPETTLRQNVADLEFTDVVSAVRHHAKALRDADVDLIAVVGHLSGSCPKGTPAEKGCSPDGEVGRLLRELPKGTIDLLVTGHSHTRLAFRHDNTIVLQSGSKGRYVGRVDLTMNPEGIDWEKTRIHPLVHLTHTPSDPGCEGESFNTTPQQIGDWTVTPSAAAIELIQKWEGVTGNLCSPAGCTTAEIKRNRNGGSMLGSVVADAMHEAFPAADIAMTNAGGLRANLPAGPLRREHIQGVMPFDNRIVLVEVTGEKLRTLFELGTSGAHGPLQVSKGVLKLSKKATARDLNHDGQSEDWEKNRLCAAEVNGLTIDSNRTYRIVTTDFLFGGGDHLALGFEDATHLQDGPLLRDHLTTWFQKHEGCVSPPDNGLNRLALHDCTPSTGAP